MPFCSHRALALCAASLSLLLSQGVVFSRSSRADQSELRNAPKIQDASDVAPSVPAVGIGPNWENRLRAHLGPRGRSELDLIDASPALLPQTLAHTWLAFTAAGWPAAKEVFTKIVISQFRGWADDDGVGACVSAWANIYTTLRLAPDQCQGVLVDGLDRITTPAAADAVAAMKKSCDALTQNGFRARQVKLSPRVLTDEEWLKIQRSAMAFPEPLSEAERGAIEAPAQTDAVTACSAQMKMDRNLLANGDAILSAFERTSFRFKARDDVVAEMQAPRRSWPSAPPDFVCPEPGTAFRLSNYGRDGRPVIHTVLGRLEFDCHIVSSVSGDRGLLFPLYAENLARPRNNFLRALWPLTLNKSAHFVQHPAFGDDIDVDDRVTGYGPHPFCGRQINAFEIIQDVVINDGERRYRIVNYWAPSLGYLVGQRTIVSRGPRPEDSSPDWDILDMRAPPLSKKL